MDVTSAAARRRFYIERSYRKRTRGSGSDLAGLMAGPGVLPRISGLPQFLFGDMPVFLVGAYATAAFAPERMTRDVDYLTLAERVPDAEARLVALGWTRGATLAFPNAKLGLFGSTWTSPNGVHKLDLIASDDAWAHAAFATTEAYDRFGERVIPLPFLVLMKIDSARGIDQGDLGRILGRLSPEDVENVVSIVEAHYDDPAAGDDIRQIAEIGRWEYDTT